MFRGGSPSFYISVCWQVVQMRCSRKHQPDRLILPAWHGLLTPVQTLISFFLFPHLLTLVACSNVLAHLCSVMLVTLGREPAEVHQSH